MNKRYLTLFLCAVLIIACATSPTGRRQLMVVSEDRAIAASKQAYVEMIKPYEQKLAEYVPAMMPYYEQEGERPSYKL